MPAIGVGTCKLSRARPAPTNSPFLLHDYLSRQMPRLPLQ